MAPSALEIVARLRSRWAVFPCHHVMAYERCSCGRADCGSPGKHPRTRGGVKDARRAVDGTGQLEAWGKRWPHANVGVATGPASGLVVVDLDGPQAIDWYELLAAGDPPTLTQRTPRPEGGRHVFYRYPEVGRVANSASKTAEHVDVRGDGGYVIVAPSNHVHGRYEWIDAELDPQPIPPWLGALLLDDKSPAEQRTGPKAGATLPSKPRNEGVGMGDTGRYGTAALRAEEDRIRASGPGSRNHVLNQAAFDLGQLVAGGELDEANVRSVLEDAARLVGLGETEIQRTIGSGLRAGMQHPRGAPSPPVGRPPRFQPFAVDLGGGGGAAAGGGGSSASSAPRRTIQANHRRLEELADELLDALVDWNQPPKVFVRGGELVRVTPDEDGRPRIGSLTVTTLRHFAARSASFVSLRRTADSEIARPCFPPKEAVQDVLERGSWPFPELRAVSASPIVRPDGSIFTDHGYDKATGYFHWSPGGPIAAVPDTPTLAERDLARARLWDALRDFPFETEADRANAHAFLLTPLLRPLLDAVPPMALVDAPQPGTGKGMLVKLMSVIAFGDVQPMTPIPERDEELAKQLTAYLLAGQPMVVLDNAEKPLRSPTLAAALTSDPYQGRVLGQSHAPSVPNRAIYVATGNNVAVAGDLARRAYRIRLNAAAPDPDRRGGFAHDPLLVWARSERPKILHAMCVLVRAWYVAGRPADLEAPGLGESTPWVRMVGGILTLAGVHGFLRNADSVKADTDVEEAEWATFFAAWHHRTSTSPQTVVDVTRLLESNAELRDSIPARLVSAWDTKSWNTALGNALRSRLGRFHGPQGWHLRRHGQDRSGRYLWTVATYAPPSLGEAYDAGDAAASSTAAPPA